MSGGGRGWGRVQGVGGAGTLYRGGGGQGPENSLRGQNDRQTLLKTLPSPLCWWGVTIHRKVQATVSNLSQGRGKDYRSTKRNKLNVC